MPPPRRVDRIRVGASFAAQALLFTTLVSHIPEFEESLGFSDRGATIALLAVAVLAATGSLLSAQLARRLGGRTMLVLSVGAVGAPGLVLALAPTGLVFAIAIGCYGVALGCLDVALNSNAVRVEQIYQRSLLSSFHATWSAVGIAATLLIALSQHERWSWRGSVTTAAALTLLTAVSLTLGDSQLHESATDHAKPTTHDAAPRVSRVNRRVACIAIVIFSFDAVDAAASDWSVVYAREVVRSSAALATLGYSAYLAASLVSRLLGDRIVDRRGRPWTVRAGAVIAAGGIAIFLILPAPATTVIGLAVLGLGLGVLAPLAYSAAGTVDPAHPSRTLARVNAASYVGSIVGAVVVGAVGSALGFRPAFLLPLALTAAATAASREL